MKKILSRLTDFCKKTGKYIKKVTSNCCIIFGSFKKWLSVLIKTKSFCIVFKSFVYVVFILAFIQIFVAVAVYGFKEDIEVAPLNSTEIPLPTKAMEVVGMVMPIPVALANYDFVTLNEYQSEKAYIHHFYVSTKQDSVDFKVIDEQILEQLIENKILNSQAIRYRVNVEKKDIDESINNIVVQNGGQDKVEKVLEDLYGLSLKDFRRLVRVQILRDKINDKVIARVGARHILIRFGDGATEDQIEAARVKTSGILTEIQNGLDFGEAAKKYSEDTGSAADGGLLQPFAQGEMVQEFSDTAFKTNVGEISQPVKTEFGWHIIKVESKTGTIEKKFSDWMEELKEKGLILKLYEIK